MVCSEDRLVTSRRHVLFLNRSYWPDIEATGQLLTDLTEDLVDEFDVTVVAGLPNHVQEGTSLPSSGRESRRGIEILRVPHTRFGKHSFVGRLTNLVTYSVSACLRATFVRRPDIVVAETDPFFLPLVGRWLCWRYGCRFVAYLQDVYPDVAVAVGKVREGWLTRLLRSLLVAAYQAADRVVVLSRDMAERCARNGVDDDRLELVRNWVDVDAVRPVPVEQNSFRARHQLEGKFVVMYSGNMGVAHLLSPILEAAERLRDRDDIHFVLVGEGAQKQLLQDEATARNLTNICFLPYQPRGELADSLSAADVHVISMRDEVRGCVMPSKLYGILAVGRPIVALCPSDCELADVVREHRLGKVCEAVENTDDCAAFAGAIEELANMPAETRASGVRARELAVSEYHRRCQTERFRRVLRSVVGETISRSASDDDARDVQPTGSSVSS